MHDIKLIREDYEAFDKALAARGVAPVGSVLHQIDKEYREALQDIQDAQAKRNSLSKEIGQAMKDGEKDLADVFKNKVGKLKERLPLMEQFAEQRKAELDAQLESLPNFAAEGVPQGENEDDNVELRKWGTPPELGFEAKEHDTLGLPLGMDFEAAAAISGARFVVLKGQIARLERALGQFMLDQHTSKNGYEEVVAPALVWDQALYGTGQLPKFSEDLFKTTANHWLIPTAEVPLTNLVREQITSEEELPKRYTALTQCFRSEAGAAGRDTRGMIRQHQFNKVELVAITAPEKSEEEHERMTEAAEGILKALELPFRTMLLCTGDMGFSARKTYDLEVWLPGQGRYREISSVSNCGDFQARRMKARMRRTGEKGTELVHTLNGSGLAVGRTLVAVLENYQQEDGSIAVPSVLQPYMGGVTTLTAA